MLWSPQFKHQSSSHSQSASREARKKAKREINVTDVVIQDPKPEVCVRVQEVTNFVKLENCEELYFVKMPTEGLVTAIELDADERAARDTGLCLNSKT